MSADPRRENPEGRTGLPGRPYGVLPKENEALPGGIALTRFGGGLYAPECERLYEIGRGVAESPVGGPGHAPLDYSQGAQVYGFLGQSVFV